MWILYSGGPTENAGIGYAWSWDRIHWTKAAFNPVFRAGGGPFLERCYTPSLVRDAAIPNPALGDEWFNTDFSHGGKWEKYTGTDWKRT